MKSFFNRLTLIVGLALVLGCGCDSRPSKEEQKTRELAIIYRDAYMSGYSVLGNEEIYDSLSQSTIQSVEKSSNGWLVVFLGSQAGIKAGSTNQPRKLHVYITPTGKLERAILK